MSDLEDSLAFQLMAAKVPPPEREYRFHDTRKWRLDFAWVEQKVAAEVEGGVYVQGRHTRGAGVEKDAEKYNEAALLGWKVLRFTRKTIKSGEALKQIERALGITHAVWEIR